MANEFERYTGLNVTLFTMTDSPFVADPTLEYFGDLSDASMTVEVETEEASGVADEFEIAYPTGSKWTLTGNFFCNTTLARSVMNRAINAARRTGTSAGATTAQNISIVFTTSAGKSYTGVGLITTCAHKVGKGLQAYDVTIAGYGALS